MPDFDLSPATWEQVKNRSLDSVSVTDFGAVGDGVTDDTAAIQSALNSAVDRIHVPAGSYVSSTLTVPNGVSLIGDGAGETIIIAENLGATVSLFEIGLSALEGQTTSITGMTISAKGDNAKYAISTPQTSTTSFKPRYVFSNLLFKGTELVAGGSSWEQDYGFEACIRLGDCMGADLRDIQVWGTYDMDADESTSVDQTGLYFDGVESLRNVVVDNYLTSDLKYGIDLGENNTSIYLSNVDCARSWYGIRTVATGNNGEFFATGCTFNAQRIGVELKNRSWSVLQGVHSTRHSSGFDHSEQWNGFAFTGTNNMFVSNCRSLCGGTWANVGDRIAFNLSDVLFSKFTNILCSSLATDMEYGFKIADSSTDLMFSNIFFDDVATWWDFGVGTTDINIGNHSHRGAFTIKYAYDASITESTKQDFFIINGNRVNFNSGLLLVDPEDNSVSIQGGVLVVDDGAVKFGTHTAIGAETIDGYITIVDAGGTTRRLATVS